MNIPTITGIEDALRVYYANSELGNKEIAELFGRHSSATVAKLKKLAKTEMRKKEVLSYSSNKVNTEIAFTVWGIDIHDLERRRKKIKELGL